MDSPLGNFSATSGVGIAAIALFAFLFIVVIAIGAYVYHNRNAVEDKIREFAAAVKN